MSHPGISKKGGTTDQFALRQDERIKICKYDKSHRILASKYVLHLRKCRGNYLKQQAEDGLPVEIEVCMFNYHHHMPAAELAKHIAPIGGTCKTALKNGLIKPAPGHPMPSFNELSESDSD